MSILPLYCRRTRRLLAALLAIALLTLGIFAAGSFRDGLYYGTAMGRNGWISVSVSVTDGKIAAIDVDGPQETPVKLGQALAIVERMLGLGDLNSIRAVDTISGATMSSEGIKNAVLNALRDQTPSWLHGAGEDCPGADFTDLPAYGNWAHTPIDWAVAVGVTSGTSKTTFSPDAVCTRAQVVTFLWRAAGSPEPVNLSLPLREAEGEGEESRDFSSQAPQNDTVEAFSDVPADAYYADAVLWAVDSGITKGTVTGRFSPNDPCTRAQVVTFLWRAAGSPDPVILSFALREAEGEGEEFLHSSSQAPQNDTVGAFSDVPATAYYATAVSWAVETGVTQGTGNNRFSPSDPCTRAQVVTFLYRWDCQ